MTQFDRYTNVGPVSGYVWHGPTAYRNKWGRTVNVRGHYEKDPRAAAVAARKLEEETAVAAAEAKLKAGEDARAASGRVKYGCALITTEAPQLDYSAVKGVLAFREWKMDEQWHGDHLGGYGGYEGRYPLSPVIGRYFGGWKSVTFADEPPSKDNHNGLYARAVTPQGYHELVRGRYSDSGPCGLVELRGKIVEHEDGVIRAECARILQIWYRVGRHSYDGQRGKPRKYDKRGRVKEWSTTGGVEATDNLERDMAILATAYPTIPLQVVTDKQVNEALFNAAIFNSVKHSRNAAAIANLVIEEKRKGERREG